MSHMGHVDFLTAVIKATVLGSQYWVFAQTKWLWPEELVLWAGRKSSNASGEPVAICFVFGLPTTGSLKNASFITTGNLPLRVSRSSLTSKASRTSRHCPRHKCHSLPIGER